MLSQPVICMLSTLPHTYAAERTHQGSRHPNRYWHNLLADWTPWPGLSLLFAHGQLLVAFIISGVVLIIQVRTVAISDAKARTMDITGDALLLVIIVIGLMLNNPVTLPSTADGLNVSGACGWGRDGCQPCARLQLKSEGGESPAKRLRPRKGSSWTGPVCIKLRPEHLLLLQRLLFICLLLLPALSRVQNTLMAIVIGYLSAAGILISVEITYTFYISILMSRCERLTHVWGATQALVATPGATHEWMHVRCCGVRVVYAADVFACCGPCVWQAQQHCQEVGAQDQALQIHVQGLLPWLHDQVSKHCHQQITPIQLQTGLGWGAVLLQGAPLHNIKVKCFSHMLQAMCHRPRATSHVFCSHTQGGPAAYKPSTCSPDPPCAAPCHTRWLPKAKAIEWQEWHRLGLLLADYVHPTSETSYLSDRKVNLCMG